MKEKCVLYDRDCINCGECEFCDLDPTKLCDNCGKCLESDVLDYAAIKIDGIRNSDDDNNFRLYHNGSRHRHKDCDEKKH